VVSVGNCVGVSVWLVLRNVCLSVWLVLEIL
jgi:hypothetical protein